MTTNTKQLKWLIWKMKVLNQDLNIYFPLFIHPMVEFNKTENGSLVFLMLLPGNYSLIKHIFTIYVIL